MLADVLGKMSKRLKVSAFLISFLFMAAATTMPELFVGVISSIEGEGGLAFGTVIGSNIANIALILGFLLIINSKVSVRGEISRQQSVLLAAISLLPLLLISDKILSRIDGVILLCAFVFYCWQLIKNSYFFRQIEKVKSDSNFWFEIGKFVVAVFILLLASRYTVKYAQEIALSMNLPIIIIGIFIVSLGASLPEMIFAIRSSQSDNPHLSMGDIIGSVVFNATIILGVSSIIRPIVVENIHQYLIAGLALFLVMLYFIMANYHSKLFSRKWGIILILFYITFLVVELV